MGKRVQFWALLLVFVGGVAWAEEHETIPRLDPPESPASAERAASASDRG